MLRCVEIRAGRARVFLILAAVGGLLGAAAAEGRRDRLLPALEVDHAALVSRAGLAYDAPVARSEEGVPLGNGRMGSLVWTSPSVLRFQVNRADVYPMNGSSHSFFERNSDYCCGTGFVDIDLGSAAGDVFTAPAFSQTLSVHDGLLTVQGRGVRARLLAWHAQDAFAIEIEDRRDEPQPITLRLRVLRFASPSLGNEHEKAVTENLTVTRMANHTATSQLLVRTSRAVLRQEFREKEHFSSSALAMALVGRPSSAHLPHPGEAQVSAPAARGRVLVLVGSAASFQAGEDVVARALAPTDAASAQGFDALYQDNRRHWADFWARGFVDLSSADGSAELVGENYHYFLYLMAASSRGRFPPKFNGMLWNTSGDLRTWGSQHWFANLSCYYEALFAANRLELLEPAFDMYSGMREASARAARQQWGSQGIFIPETTWFDGLEPLPEDIAAEMRELYLLRKPWAERSPRFLEFAGTKNPHSSRWNFFGGGSYVDGRWVPKERGFGPFGPVTHILGTTAKVAYLFWRRYEYTLDAAWLRERAYPMLQGAADFYRHFPNLRKGEDGRYHIHHVNSNESVLGARDTDEDLSAMRGVLAAAIRASEILGRDAESRAAWREILENLAPLPVSDDPEALRPADYAGPRVFVRGLKPAVDSRGLLPDANSLPAYFFDLHDAESPDREGLATAQATFAARFREGISADTRVGVLSKLPIAAAILGRKDAVRFLIPNQIRALSQERPNAYKGGGVLANRLALREGHQALDAQRLGRAAEALHLSLLQSGPSSPAGEPLIRVFPALPDEWDAAFTLRARGSFLVTSSRRRGQVELVELQSLAGAVCRLRNPWGERAVRLFGDSGRTERLRGPRLNFETAVGERILLVPEGVEPGSVRSRIPR
jgi:hypothetical protein